MKLTPKSLKFSAIYLFAFVAEAVSYCFMMAYLISLGYSTMQRSVIFAGVAVFSILGQVIVGFMCDRFRFIKPLAFILFIFYIFINAAFYLYPGHDYLVHLLLAAFTGAMMNICDGLLDSWVLESDSECNSHYGTIRAQGSLGWAVGSPLAAFIVSQFGYKGLSWGFASVCLIILLIALLIPDAQKKGSATPLKFSDTRQLLKNQRYRLAIAILFFIFLIGDMCNYAVIDKLTILKATDMQISWYWTLQAIVELPMFFAGDFLNKKFGLLDMLKVAALALGIRYVLYGFAANATQMILLSLLQFFSFGLQMVAAKRIIDEQTPAYLKSSGQQTALALYSSGSLLAAPLLSGVLETVFGINTALIIIGLIAVIPLSLLAVYKKLPAGTSR